MSAFTTLSFLLDGPNHTGTGWSSVGHKYHNQTNSATGPQTFRLGNAAGTSLWAGHDIVIDFTTTSGQYAISDGPNPGDGASHPTHFYVGSSNPTSALTASSINLVNTTDYLYVNQDTNSAGSWVKINLSGPGSGSGSGGGIQTLSGGSEPEIINVTFTRVNEFDIDLEFEYQNLGNVNVKKILADGTETVATISPSGYSTSTSGEGKITYTLSYGDTWWLEHPPSDLFTVLPTYKLEKVKWTLNKVSGNLTAKGWFPDNGGNGFGSNYDVGLSAFPPHSGIIIVDKAFKSTTEENTLIVQYNPGTLYRVLNIDTSQFGSGFRTSIPKVFSNFW